MSEREEFEKWFPRAWLDYGGDIHAITFKAWQEQQKKIDELEAENPQEECIECGGYGFTVKGGAEHHPQCNGDCSICPIDGGISRIMPKLSGAW